MEADTRHILSMSFQCLYTGFILGKKKIRSTGTDNKHIATFIHLSLKKNISQIQNLSENIFLFFQQHFQDAQTAIDILKL